MKRYVLLALLAALQSVRAQTAEQAEAALQRRAELDEVRWADPARGPAIKTAILRATDAGLEVRKTTGATVLTRVLPYEGIGGVKFSLSRGERQLIADARPESVPALRVFWEARRRTLKLQGSNAGELGLALARALRTSTAVGAEAEALAIAKEIAAEEADPLRRARGAAEAQTASLQQALRQATPEEAEKQAREVVEKSDDGNADLMLLATGFLMKREFEALKQVEAENPRWVEDEEIKPERERHYHLALDFALYPSVFQPLRATESAEGLWQACLVYQYTRDQPRLENALEDLLALYPGSPRQSEAQALLASLKAAAPKAAASTAPAPEKPAGQPEPAPPPPPPPAPKKYNLFDD